MRCYSSQLYQGDHFFLPKLTSLRKSSLHIDPMGQYESGPNLQIDEIWKHDPLIITPSCFKFVFGSVLVHCSTCRFPGSPTWIEYMTWKGIKFWKRFYQILALSNSHFEWTLSLSNRPCQTCLHTYIHLNYYTLINLFLSEVEGNQCMT